MPDVPPEFLWRDRNGNEVIVMYSPFYGNTTGFPGSQHVLAQLMKGDNMELPGREEVIARIELLKTAYPHAKIEATSYSAFAENIAHLKDTLPVITGEIGDSWIHGVGSDPLKTAQYRALSRLRKKLIQEKAADENDDYMIQFSNHLMLIAEHTWGVSHTPHIGGNENCCCFRNAAGMLRFIWRCSGIVQ